MMLSERLVQDYQIKELKQRYLHLSEKGIGVLGPYRDMAKMQVGNVAFAMDHKYSTCIADQHQPRCKGYELR